MAESMLNGSYEEFEDPIPDVEDTEDGGAMVMTDEQRPQVAVASDNNFYRNLVFDLPEKVLDDLADDLLEKFKYDKEAREKKEKMYAEGLKRTGLGGEAPGGATFEGASKVVHPMLTTSAVEFEARAIKELFPPGGPVKSHIVGTVTRQRWERAERLKKFYNWQLTVQMPEFRPELEKVLTQSGLAGAEYQRFVWNPRFKRSLSSSVPLDKVLLPYAASSFYTAERITYIDDITEMEYKKRVRDGLYRDIELVPVSMPPEKGPAAQARDKIEGKDEVSPYNDDGLRRTFESNTFIEDIEKHLEDGVSEAFCPYMIYIDDNSRKVLAIVRNWEQEDSAMERMHWMIEWPFVPWEGVYPIGLTQMIGSLSAAATGALRALLDSAHVNNIPAAARLKGAQVGGQSKTVQPGQILEVDGGVGAEDIRKLMMPFQYNPPSPTLYQLLGFLVEAGQEAVKTAFEKFSDNNPNAPVGTVYAYIEQGLVVVSAIIGRMHLSMGMALRILHRINKMYVTDEEIYDDTGELLAKRSDFQGPLDVVPVSDPSTPSDAHRFAQIQSIMQRADVKVGLYDARKVEKLFLERMRVPDPEGLLMPVQEPQEMNAANENAAAVMGRPITAFPEQDHLAHLQTHLDFMQSPVLGMLPTIAPKFLNGILTHLSEHIALWYITQIFEQSSDAVGKDITELMGHKDAEVKAELDRLIATVSPDVVAAAGKAFNKLPPIILKAMQTLQSMTPQMQDPNAQVQSQRNEIQRENNHMMDQHRREALQVKKDELKIRVVEGGQKIQADVEKEGMQQDAETGRLHEKEAGETMRTEAKIQSAERINEADNLTAMAIAEAEIKSGEKVAKSTGKDSSPGK